MRLQCTCPRCGGAFLGTIKPSYRQTYCSRRCSALSSQSPKVKRVLICGVYAIVHRASGRAYVGSSVDVHARLLQHRVNLTKGRWANRNLQAAWDRFGADAFAFVILERLDAPAARVAREQVWMDRFKVRGGLFNTHTSAESARGFKRPAESRAAIGAAKIGERNPSARLRSADIPMILDRLASGEPGESIARSLGVSGSTINRVKYGKSWSHAVNHH